MDEAITEALREIGGNLTELKAIVGDKICREVARVYTGVQPGDAIGRSDNTLQDILGNLMGLKLHNHDFVFDVKELHRSKNVARVLIAYWNQDVIDCLDLYPDLPDRFKEVSLRPASGYRSRIEGAFYGFPECCVGAWILETGIGADVIGSLAYRTRRVLGDLREERRERDRTLPDMRRYIEHVPCTASCAQTIRMIETYREVHDFVDRL